MIRGFQVLFGWSSVDRLAHSTAPVLLENCGHFAELEDPDAFHAALEGWMDRTM